jgi:hypothetical protein
VRKKIAFSFINAVKQPCVIIEQNDVVHVNIAFREIVIVE